MKHTLHEGDCIEAMRRMEPGSIDAVVCDPPYSLGFMGKTWDSHSSPRAFQSWCRQWAAEALRVLKPGGHLVAFGGTRTHHRLASGIEDAGFEIRDTLAWLYGSGFPKSLDVSKAIDRAAGAEREIVDTVTKARSTSGNSALPTLGGETVYRTWPVTVPETPEAHAWQGWGTALKPAYEPIVLARKPLSGTVSENVLSHGVGAINIDASRIGSDGGTRQTIPKVNGTGREATSYGISIGSAPGGNEDAGGRWPANVMLDDEAAAVLGEASRFFYTSKASTRQRNAGLHDTEDGNRHATVKPLDVMRWLCRLVTPPGGVVLDPFTGSGTTGMAAIAEGFTFVGCEMDAEFLKIADTRIREAYVLAPT